LPASVSESARMDGAGDFTVFTRIMLPMAKPVLATVTLFLAVGQWNTWYDTYIYTTGEHLITLQGILINILKEAQAAMYANTKTTAEMIESAQTITPDNIKNATILITTLPIIMVYPFLQKYFVKGIMLGAVKG
ncbi:MAG: ABC transporter permease subunit, partial [Clostridia bacterium]